MHPFRLRRRSSSAASDTVTHGTWILASVALGALSVGALAVPGGPVHHWLQCNIHSVSNINGNSSENPVCGGVTALNAPPPAPVTLSTIYGVNVYEAGQTGPSSGAAVIAGDSTDILLSAGTSLFSSITLSEGSTADQEVTINWWTANGQALPSTSVGNGQTQITAPSGAYFLQLTAGGTVQYSCYANGGYELCMSAASYVTHVDLANGGQYSFGTSEPYGYSSTSVSTTLSGMEAQAYDLTAAG